MEAVTGLAEGLEVVVNLLGGERLEFDSPAKFETAFQGLVGGEATADGEADEAMLVAELVYSGHSFGMMLGWNLIETIKHEDEFIVI